MLLKSSAHRLTLAMAILAYAFVAPMTGRAEVRLHPEHAANRLDGLKAIRFADGVLTLEAQRPTTGMLVLTCSSFLDVTSVSNAKVVTRRDWDKVLGYYHVLDLTVPAAGEVKVGLRLVASPKAPFPTTAAEMAAFREEFQHRPSRFSNDPEAFKQWQKAYRAKLAAWLMGGGLPACVPLEARIIETKEFPKFTLRRVEYRSQQDRQNTLLISLPKGVKKVPVLLAIHGHENTWGQAPPTPIASAARTTSAPTLPSAGGPWSSQPR